jgi:hypothetical protein
MLILLEFMRSEVNSEIAAKTRGFVEGRSKLFLKSDIGIGLFTIAALKIRLYRGSEEGRVVEFARIGGDSLVFNAVLRNRGPGRRVSTTKSVLSRVPSRRFARRSDTTARVRERKERRISNWAVWSWISSWKWHR